MQEVHDESIKGEAAPASRARAAAGEKDLTTVYLVAAAVAIGAVFCILQFSTAAILDVDGYYHIKWSRLIWEGIRSGRFPPPFPWLPLTTLNPKDYVDHHLLFHILLIPFTWFPDLRMGAKVAAALFGSLAVFSCYLLVIRYRIRYPLLWLAALLAASGPFLYRMSMTRAQGVSVIFMVAGIYLLFEQRYRWLVPLAFLYVWTYSLFVMLCAAAVIWTGVVLWTERRFDWRPVVWTAVGTVAGFVINPYFPRNVSLFVAHALMKITPGDFSTSVGMEWYPYESWFFFYSSIVAFVAMVVGYVAVGRLEREGSARPLFFLFFSTLLLVANARSRRFVEYWPPFAVLFAAFALEAVFEMARRTIARLPTDIMDELEPYLDRHEAIETVQLRRRAERPRLYAAGVVGLLIGIVLVSNVWGTAESIAGEQSPLAYQKGVEWIRANVPRGEIIFNTDWDDFPKLFFYDSDHRYVSGLDPTYLLDANAELAKLNEDITLGRIKDPGPIIRDRFGAHYVFTDNEEIHDAFQINARDSGWFEEVYADDQCTVLRILDQPRESPQDEDMSESGVDDQGAGDTGPGDDGPHKGAP
jgi:hypothetical protein